MDPKVSLSAMLAQVANNADSSMMLANGNSPLGSLGFGQQTVDASTHNHHQPQVKAPFFLNSQQLTAALAAANFKFDSQQFAATSPPNNNNFIAASPLSSISSSLSSGANDASPNSFASLSALSPSNLQQLKNLISPSLDVVGSTQIALGTDSSAEILQRLRGVFAQNSRLVLGIRIFVENTGLSVI